MTTLFLKLNRMAWLLALVLISISNAWSQSRLKVMTYNIHHANPPAKPDYIDIHAIAKVINDSGADAVALQELDVNNMRSGKNMNQAEELATLTGMHHFFAKGIDFQGGEYGVAILSKYPIVGARRYALPIIEGSGGEPRALAVATLLLDGGEKVTFACTHLDLVEENRLLQADFIIKKLGKKRKMPVIFCGDLNAEPGSAVMDRFLTHFSRSIPDGPTYPQVNPSQRLDYILYRPKDSLTVTKPKIINETYASDHLPLYVEFEL